MKGRVRLCLENNGVEQRGLCGELIDRDIEDEEVDNGVGWTKEQQMNTWEEISIDACRRGISLIW